MRPDEELVDASTLRTSLWLEDGQGRQFTLETAPGEDGVRRGTIDLMAFKGSRRIFVQAIGKTNTGEGLEYLESPIELEGLLPPPDPIEPVPSADSVADEKAPEPVREEPDQALDVSTSWRSAALWFGLLNLILLTAGGGVYWWLQMLKKRQAVILVDDAASCSLKLPEGQTV
jgi:hypothetical protein